MSKLPSSGGSWEARKSGPPKQIVPPTAPAPVARPAAKPAAKPTAKTPAKPAAEPAGTAPAAAGTSDTAQKEA